MEKTAKQILKAHYLKITSKGGKSTLRKHGKEHFAKMGLISATKRYGKSYPQENKAESVK